MIVKASIASPYEPGGSDFQNRDCDPELGCRVDVNLRGRFGFQTGTPLKPANAARPIHSPAAVPPNRATYLA